MGWNRNDGRQYQGTLLKVFVSSTEVMKIEDYIDYFLRTRGYELSDSNRDTIAAKLERIPERHHHTLNEVDRWLDFQFSG